MCGFEVESYIEEMLFTVDESKSAHGRRLQRGKGLFSPLRLLYGCSKDRVLPVPSRGESSFADTVVPCERTANMVPDHDPPVRSFSSFVNNLRDPGSWISCSPIPYQAASTMASYTWDECWTVIDAAEMVRLVSLSRLRFPRTLRYVHHDGWQ